MCVLLLLILSGPTPVLQLSGRMSDNDPGIPEPEGVQV
jgi:hypothetical protein